MITNATKRTILRATHLIFSIPILGYIYSPPAQAQQYANAARFIFVPLLILSGFWMYAGVLFAIIGVGLWLAAYELSGSGAAILGQIALFIVWRVWLAVRARRRQVSA